MEYILGKTVGTLIDLCISNSNAVLYALLQCYEFSKYDEIFLKYIQTVTMCHNQLTLEQKCFQLPLSLFTVDVHCAV